MGKEYTRFQTIIGQVPTFGAVTLFDDFNNLLKWTIVNGKGDYILELDPNLAFSGNQSLHLKTRTTDAAIDDTLSCSRHLYLPISGIVSYQCLFRFVDPTKFDYFRIQLAVRDEANALAGALFFHPNDPILKYVNSAGGYTSIANSDLALSNLTWHHIGLEIDLINSKYIRAFLNHKEFDLSDISIFADTDTNPRRFKALLDINTIGAAPADINIDNVLITQLT